MVRKMQSVWDEVLTEAETALDVRIVRMPDDDRSGRATNSLADVHFRLGRVDHHLAAVIRIKGTRLIWIK